MRLRNKPWTDDFLKLNSNKLIEWNEKDKIVFKKIFKNNNPVHLEIGCGKGQFISTLALLNNDINYVGMEKEKTVIAMALKKTMSAFENKKIEMKNIKFLNKYAEKLTDIFEVNSIDRIYLNFSDPWPKAKHAKKRLTYVKFLDMYNNILKDDGEIHIKTDNDKLYDSTLDQLKKRLNWKIIYKTSDLYDDPKGLEGNVATEYEIKFNSIGKNINKIIIKK